VTIVTSQCVTGQPDAAIDMYCVVLVWNLSWEIVSFWRFSRFPLVLPGKSRYRTRICTPKYLTIRFSPKGINRNSVVGIVIATALGVRVSNPGNGKKVFSYPNRPNWFWGPPSLLFNEYGSSF
jgi:hypothetical protein